MCILVCLKNIEKWIRKIPENIRGDVSLVSKTKQNTQIKRVPEKTDTEPNSFSEMNFKDIKRTSRVCR